MTWSRPSYMPVPMPEHSGPAHYALYRVADGGSPRAYACASGLSILFVPGNKGSHLQARSLASAFAEAEAAPGGGGGPCVDVYAASFGGESAVMLGGGALSRQALWVASAGVAVAHAAARGGGTPPRLLLVGHSLGGIVARAAAAPLLEAFDVLDGGGLVGVLTLAAPHLRAPAAFDRASARFYRALAAQWARRSPLMTLPLVSVSGGAGDGQVVEAEADVRALVPPEARGGGAPRLWLSARAAEAGGGALQLRGAPAAGGGVEHQAVVWCSELLRAVVDGVRAGEAAARGPDAGSAWAAAFAAAAAEAPGAPPQPPPPLAALLRNAAAAFPLRYGTSVLSLAILIAAGAVSSALQGGGGGGGGASEALLALAWGPFAALGAALGRCGVPPSWAPPFFASFFAGGMEKPPLARGALAAALAAALLRAGVPAAGGGQAAQLAPLLGAAAARLNLPPAAAAAVEWAIAYTLASALVAALRGASDAARAAARRCCCGGAPPTAAAAALPPLLLLSAPAWAARGAALLWLPPAGAATLRGAALAARWDALSFAAAVFVVVAAAHGHPAPPLPPLPPPQPSVASSRNKEVPPPGARAAPASPPRCLCASAGAGGAPPAACGAADADCWATLPARLVARLAATDGGAAAAPVDAAAAFADLQRRAARWSRVRIRPGAVLVALPDSAQLPAALLPAGAPPQHPRAAAAPATPWLPSLNDVLRLPACVLLHFLCAGCACPHPGGHPTAARFFDARAAVRRELEGPHAPQALTWADVAAWEVLDSEAAGGGEGEAGGAAAAARAAGALQLAAALLLGAAAVRAAASPDGLNDAGAFVL